MSDQVMTKSISWSSQAEEQVQKLSSRWHTAEEILKQSEFIVGRPNTEAQAQLRYAGRHVIYAWENSLKLNAPDWAISDNSHGDEEFEVALHHLDAAIHDTFDVVVSKFDLWRAAWVNKFGIDRIRRLRPDAVRMFELLDDTKEQLRVARADVKNSSMIYKLIEEENFPILLRYYKELDMVLDENTVYAPFPKVFIQGLVTVYGFFFAVILTAIVAKTPLVEKSIAVLWDLLAKYGQT